MNIQKTLIVLLFFISTPVYAHCPAAFKAEKVCFMLDKNKFFIYDQNLEHSGPYKNMARTEVSTFKNDKGEILAYKKVARGIYEIEATEIQKNIIVVLTFDKKKNEIKVKHE